MKIRGLINTAVEQLKAEQEKVNTIKSILASAATDAAKLTQIEEVVNNGN
jgi:hypothetical protein